MKRFQKIRRLYEGERAKSYEVERSSELKWIREQQAVEDLLNLAKPSTVLDIPVGTGRFIPLYRSMGIRATGLDISEDMLQQAKKRSTGARLGRADITAIPMADLTTDVSVCIRFMNLIDFPIFQSALSELSRVSSVGIIVGIRVYRPLHEKGSDPLSIYALNTLRRIKLAATAQIRQVKMRPHKEAQVLREFDRLGLQISARRHVHRGADGSSYDTYLLSLFPTEGASKAR